MFLDVCVCLFVNLFVCVFVSLCVCPSELHETFTKGVS